MEIYLYNFEKKQNSTYFPPRTSGVKFDGQMATTFDVVAPVVTFALPATAAPTYNHAEIPAFDRKYFVDSWIFVAGRWQAQLSVDVLATYKQQIGNASLYVLRSSATFDGGIIDTQYPAVGGKIKLNNRYYSDFANNVTAGTFVVGIVNSDDNIYKYGSTSYYIFTPTDFRNFMSNLLGGVDYLNISATEISESLQKAIVNPFQYITSVVWFPYESGFEKTIPVNPIPVGWWSVSGNAYQLTTAFSGGYSKQITVPKHPQASARGAWVNKSPSAVYSLEIPPWGTIPLDSDKIYDVDTLWAYSTTDNITGASTLRVETLDPENNTLIATASAQLGIPIQLAQLSMDWSNLTSSTVGVAGLAGGASTFANGLDNSTGTVAPAGSSAGMRQSASAFFDWAQSGGIRQTASNIGNALNSILAEVSIMGATGSTVSVALPTYINAFFTLFAEDDNDHNGRPLCAIRQLSSIPGFILVKDAEIGFGRTLGEQNLIRSYLEGGFFYE